MAKKKVFVFIDWYDPAYKGGGPIIASMNFVQQMKTAYALFIFTGNKDLGETQPLKDIVSDVWVKKEEDVHVFYASDKNLTLSNIKKELHTVAPHFVYINSIYSKNFSFLPLLINRFWHLQTKVIIAPRGMLKDSAVNHKKTKKIIFLKIFRWLNLHRNIVFQASDQTEKNDIQLHFGRKNSINIIPDFVAFEPYYNTPPEKKPGALQIVFVGRIHPIKNLYFLLECLEAATGDIWLTIIGNIEDEKYWAGCAEKIKSLPVNITVDMKKDVPHQQIRSILLKHHVFMLPTKGENFGHAIFEALTLGKPVIISDQTPWRSLTLEKAGWDLPLNNKGLYVNALMQAIGWNQETYNEWSMHTWCFAKEFDKKADILTKYKSLFS